MFVREGKGVGVVVEGRSVGLMQSAIGLWQCRLAVGWRKKGLRRGTITISSSVAKFRCQVPSQRSGMASGRERQKRSKKTEQKKGVAQSGAHTGARTSTSVINKL